MKTLADEIGRKVFDQSAETISELVEATGQTRSYIGKLAKAQIASGKWEQVWKKTGPKVVPAYRRKSSQK